jgi:hypothetical protein
MNPKTCVWRSCAAAAMLVTFSKVGVAGPPEKGLLELDPKDFDGRSTIIDHAWWPLTPGTRLTYDGFHIEDGKPIAHSVVDTVTDLTKVINGVRVLVNLEEDYSDGRLIEQEIAFHAQDKDGNVWHLGQYRETYDDTQLVGGSVWFVGYPEGAKAGIRMTAQPRIGTTYSQGFAPAPFYWTDRSRVSQMGQETEVPAGTYKDVMVIEEWDAETPEGVFQLKYYAKGVGIVRIGFKGPDPEQEEVVLVKVEQLSAEELAKARDRALKIDERGYLYQHTSPAERIGISSSAR